MRTKGCRKLTEQERLKIAADLKKGKTYKEIMTKYGLRSDSAIRRVRKDYNISYVPERKRNVQVPMFDLDWESKYRVSIEKDENDIVIITQGNSQVYLIADDVKKIVELYVR